MAGPLGVSHFLLFSRSEGLCPQLEALSPSPAGSAANDNQLATSTSESP